MRSAGGTMKGAPRHSWMRQTQKTKANSSTAVAPLNISHLICAVLQINIQYGQMEKIIACLGNNIPEKKGNRFSDDTNTH